MFPEARSLTAAELRAGLSAEFERDVSEADVLTFARNSGDANPLHVDAGYAAATSYRRRIVHGAFQVGLASAMAGMHLPGLRALLGSINARFPSPLYFPCRVKVYGQIASWQAESLRGSLKVTVTEAASRTATAEITLGFTLHETAEGRPGASSQAVREAGESRPAVLMSGASGGVGTALAAALAARYRVLALVNRTPLDVVLKNDPNITEVQAGLDADWQDEVAAALGDAPLYAAVHAAWPGMPKGGLLGSRDDVIMDQLAFGALYPVQLARLVFARAGPQGGRVVLLGSVAGTHRPSASAAAYSLGKATLEHTVRLLAPELARKGITVNAVCPSFVPVGMNAHSTERQRLLEMSSIPMGRLCAPGDVAGAAMFLLSPEAAFLSGQVIGVNGAQL